MSLNHVAGGAAGNAVGNTVVSVSGLAELFRRTPSGTIGRKEGRAGRTYGGEAELAEPWRKPSPAELCIIKGFFAYNHVQVEGVVLYVRITP